MQEYTSSFQSMAGIIGTKNGSTKDREQNDFYATDPIAIIRLLEVESLNNHIWECACGKGHLSRPLIAAGYDVKSTDLIDRGFGVGGGRLPTMRREVRRRYNHKPAVSICRRVY